jgi:ferredoxin
VAIVRIAEKLADIPVESSLLRVCDEHRLSVVFGCRQGRCGSCLVQILEGGESLRAPGEGELRTLHALDAESDMRLACQCVVTGDVQLRYV